VHLVPGTLDPSVRQHCVLVEALVTVGEEELHRGHFSLRGSQRPAERYLAHFHQIRKLQEFLARKAAEEGVAVIENVNVDEALTELMDLVLAAAGRASEGGNG
jgi:2-phosphoglycerate kinase